MNHYMHNNPVPKSFPKREREALLSELRRLLSVAEMKHTDFGRIGSPEENPTEFIRERTRLWRESWLIDPLEYLIKRYEKEQDDEDNG